MKITINPLSNTAGTDYGVLPTNLERIEFGDIRVGDVIKVTGKFDWGWDYRHVHKIHNHPTDQSKSFACGFGYRAQTGLGGCEIGADRKDWILERVEPNTAVRLLEHYQKNWTDPKIDKEFDPRKNIGTSFAA